jgi:excisionase family DNA binding protein
VTTPSTDTGIEDAIRRLVRDEVRAELAKVPALQLPAASPYTSIAEYAKERSISVSTVRNAIREGRLPAMKIGAAVRVRRDAEIGASVVPVAKNPGPTPAQVADRILARRAHAGRVIRNGSGTARRRACTSPSEHPAS